jgi:uncharacterized protein (DUF2141 family)
MEHDQRMGSAAVREMHATGRIVVEVENFRTDEGDALYALFRSDTGFPVDPLKAVQRVQNSIVDGRSRVVFDHVPAGAFAVAVLHDEDGDGKLRTGLFGIPRDGIGFSRDARGRMGPPKFQDARLLLESGQCATVLIRMHYY